MKNKKVKLMAMALAVALMIGAAAQAETLGAVGAAAQTADETLSVADIYERASGSVVQVRGMAETWSRETGASVEPRMVGTGVYLEDGYVVTCYDVVAETDFVEVETTAGQIVRAKNVFSDATVDVSVLELEEPLEGVVAATLGDSSAVRPGDQAIVIGTLLLVDEPYPATLALGYVSGVNRSSDGMGSFTRSVPLIQLDIALNEGMGGAGLFNDKGELVGLAALKGGLIEEVLYEHIGFAIPSATIERVAGDLIEHGSVKRPRMGVMVSDLDGPEEPIRTYPPAGLLVSEVEEGGPAAQAGMMMYDVITELEGVRVHNFNELSALLDTYSAGDTVHVKVYRCLDEEGNMTDDAHYVEMDIVLGILD